MNRLAALGACPNIVCSKPICLQALVIVLPSPNEGIENICGPVETPYYIDLANQLAQFTIVKFDDQECLKSG